MSDKEHPFGFAIEDMDGEAFFNMREWLSKALVAAGAKVTGGGIGFGRADLDIAHDGALFNVAIVPLPGKAKP